MQYRGEWSACQPELVGRELLLLYTISLALSRGKKWVTERKKTRRLGDEETGEPCVVAVIYCGGRMESLLTRELPACEVGRNAGSGDRRGGAG